MTLDVTVDESEESTEVSVQGMEEPVLITIPIVEYDPKGNYGCFSISSGSDTWTEDCELIDVNIETMTMTCSCSHLSDFTVETIKSSALSAFVDNNFDEVVDFTSFSELTLSNSHGIWLEGILLLLYIIIGRKCYKRDV